MMATKIELQREAKDLDKLVGERIRVARIQAGLSQDDLANKIGVSYQQVQKYETGSNRVSAGRLYQISTFLAVNVGFFFEGTPLAEMPHGGRDRSILQLVNAYKAIPDRDVKSCFLALVRQVAGIKEPDELAA